MIPRSQFLNEGTIFEDFSFHKYVCFVVIFIIFIFQHFKASVYTFAQSRMSILHLLDTNVGKIFIGLYFFCYLPKCVFGINYRLPGFIYADYILKHQNFYVSRVVDFVVSVKSSGVFSSIALYFLLSDEYFTFGRNFF